MRKLALIAFLFLGLSQFTSAQSVGVLPSILSFELAPGESGSQIVKIINNSSTRQTLEVGLGDWIRDSTGAHQYFEADTLPNSCAKYVSFTPEFIEVEGGQSAEVLVTVSMPTDGEVVEKMTWTMLFVSGTVEKTDPFVQDGVMATQINSNFRFGIHVYNTPPGIEEESAKVLDLKQVTDTSFVMTMKNTGETMLECEAFLEMVNMESGEKWKSEVNELIVFPGYSRQTEFIVPENLQKGEYEVLGLIDYSKKKSLEAKAIVISIE